jgi:DNA adenine methylase
MSVIVPPIKCQGIKTKLVPFIEETINWDKQQGIWYEPFLGSGVVLFNVCPQRAVVGDRNQHIIDFYRSVQRHEITSESMREYLERESVMLRTGGAEYYYEVRDRFNTSHSPT